MKTLTCDSDTMKKITTDTQDYTNNQAAMEEIGKSDFFRWQKMRLSVGARFRRSFMKRYMLPVLALALTAVRMARQSRWWSMTGGTGGRLIRPAYRNNFV